MQSAGSTLRHRVWRDWIRPLAVVIFTVTAVRSAIADWYVVPTGSMKPTIVEGDRIFVNKLAYDLRIPFTSRRLYSWDTPQRGDIIVFYAPGTGRRLVKRVVALPGEIIELSDNRLLIDGRRARYQAAEPPAAGHAVEPDGRHYVYHETIDTEAHPIMTTTATRVPRYWGPRRVPPDHYFVLGDNRDGSADSRAFGFVPADRILGRSSYVVLSLDPDNHHLPRPGRVLQRLP